MAANAKNQVIICAGASHRTADSAFLEGAMRRGAAVYSAFETKRPAPSVSGLHELVFLATCNRVELYAVCDASDATRAASALAAALAGDEGGDHDRIYTVTGQEAMRHLCRVAAGLDSLVVGEPEIAGQVTRAFESVLHRNGGAPLLSAVARTARIAGRRARAETTISRRPASVSTVAVQLLADELGGLRGRRVAVVGAGRMGTVASEALAAAGTRITVANRSLDRASALAASVGARAASLETLPALIAESDALLTTTSAERPLIGRAMLEPALRGRGSALVIVDIAVPRNVDPEVEGLGGVSVFGMDDLRDRVAVHIEARREEAPRVEEIIAEELAALERGDTKLLPLIGDLHRHAERIRERELTRALRALPELDAVERERIEHLTRSLVNQLLHGPSSRLRAADRSSAQEYERVVRALFELDESGEIPQT